ncbi:MAG: hypothetical protein EHM89_08120 [Acidobacteria bacterium]|nr:MAG: hypothetical protein EHM89_08120 [Acidobacteriota bacterium]
MFLTAEELLAGKEMVFDVEIPPSVLRPSLDGKPTNGDATKGAAKKVQLRPLTVKDVQLIAKAARDDEALVSALMIQMALVEPQLKQNEIANLHSGLVSFLVDAINRVSGLNGVDDGLREMIESPLAQAFFALAKEFNWTPQQVRELTVGQILGYLEMLNHAKR